MSLFRGIKSTYKKTEAAVVIQNLFEHQTGLLSLNRDSARFANALIEHLWRKLPAVLDGKFGQRPHKLAVAAAALGYGIESIRKDDPDREFIVLSLLNIFAEVETNGAFYPFHGVDYTLLETSAAVLADEMETLDTSPLSNAVEEFFLTPDSNKISRKQNSNTNRVNGTGVDHEFSRAAATDPEPASREKAKPPLPGMILYKGVHIRFDEKRFVVDGHEFSSMDSAKTFVRSGRTEATPKPKPSLHSPERALVSCPSCGQRLRVPRGRMGKLRCPRCNNTFVASTKP